MSLVPLILAATAATTPATTPATAPATELETLAAGPAGTWVLVDYAVDVGIIIGVVRFSPVPRQSRQGWLGVVPVLGTLVVQVGGIGGEMTQTIVDHTRLLAGLNTAKNNVLEVNTSTVILPGGRPHICGTSNSACR